VQTSSLSLLLSAATLLGVRDEFLEAVHSAPDRHHAARHRVVSGGRGGVSVSAGRQHADRRPGVTELTSRSSLGSVKIAIQFDLTRNIDGAARDVQGAVNAAITDLPGDLQATPSFRKSNPAAIPILILALTSKNMSPGDIYDAADTVVAPRLSVCRALLRRSQSLIPRTAGTSR
jgi:hypothetical protein